MMQKRYERQILLPQIGKTGQKRLEEAVVTVVGCGGLGCPVLTYLACAGIGTLRLVDNGIVEESNLNRQFLYSANCVGMKKTEAAAERIRELNPYIRLELFSTELTESNVYELLQGSDVVVNCLDNLPTRLISGEACVEMQIPLIEGGVSGFQGFLLVVEKREHLPDQLGFREPDEKEETAGAVLGAVPGVIGTMQAAECIKWLLRLPDRLRGRLVAVDLLDMRIERIDLR